MFLIISFSAQAQNRVGNGGNLAICGKGQVVRQAQLLDFFEAGGFDYDLPFISKIDNQDLILQDRLKVLAGLAPKLAAQYQRRLPEIKNEWDLKKDIKLTAVNDSLHAFSPKEKDCSIQQIVIRLPNLKEGKRFLVDEDLWKILTEAQKAGLVMHEMIYEHLAKLGEEDSRNARKINALIFSPRFSKMKSGEFWLFIKDLHISLYP